MYIQFYDDKAGHYDGRDGHIESYIDEAGIEIGKEMGYYEWSVSLYKRLQLKNKRL